MQPRRPERCDIQNKGGKNYPYSRGVVSNGSTKTAGNQSHACVICNSEDYEDDNLIVFCESCQLCAHQKCYGSSINSKIPENDWFCNNCTVFGYQQSLKTVCALCSQRGGLMRPSNVYYLTNKIEKGQRSLLTKKFLKNEMNKFDEYFEEDMTS